MSHYDNIPLDKPFRIDERFDSGNLKDWTTFKITSFHSGNRGVLIYFHDLERWINPPTDTAQEYNIVKSINKHGIEYLKDGEEL